MIETLAVLTVSVLGLFAGSLLTEGLLLVPYFRALKFDEFYRLHHDFGPRLYSYYAPLTVCATVLPLLLAAGAALVDPRHGSFAWLAAALCIVIMSTYFFYFHRANQAFAKKRLSEAALEQELTRWAGVHNFRTVLAICAFAASILAVVQLTGASSVMQPT
jgi:uncharacterized membrane protein YphA (DoxX/SURF4 family)